MWRTRAWYENDYSESFHQRTNNTNNQTIFNCLNNYEKLIFGQKKRIFGRFQRKNAIKNNFSKKSPPSHVYYRNLVIIHWAQTKNVLVQNVR